MKRIISKILRKFNYNIINTNYFAYIARDIFLPFKNKKDANMQIYYEGLKKSENLKSDNLSRQMRFFSLIQNVKYVLNDKNLNRYDFAECGCWKGHSSYVISKLIKESNRDIKNTFHIFDSFEGLSEPTKNDLDFFDRDIEDIKKKSIQFKSSENHLKEVLDEFDFYKIYKGWIPERFDEVEKKKFSLVHIDVDLYDPTLESLKFFYPRLEKGAIIICDDYNNSVYPGATEAWNDFFHENEKSLFYQIPLGGAFVIK